MGQPAAELAFPNRMVIKFHSLSSKLGKHELCLFSPRTHIILAFVAMASHQAERGTLDRKKTFTVGLSSFLFNSDYDYRGMGIYKDRYLLKNLFNNLIENDKPGGTFIPVREIKELELHKT